MHRLLRFTGSEPSSKTGAFMKEVARWDSALA